MNITNLSNKLVRVEYPGIVKNVENMIATLGGINAISENLYYPSYSYLKAKQPLKLT